MKLLYVKVLVLIAALGMIIYIISNLSPEKVSDSLAAIGAAPGTADAPGLQPWTRPVGEGEERFNVCRTRVHAVEWPDGKKIEEKKAGLKLTWEAHSPEARELPYLGIEKWFSRHCQIVIAKVGASSAAGTGAGSPGVPTPEFKDFLALVFVDGSRVQIRRTADGVFDFDGQTFKSADLDEAIVELKQIAQFH